MDWNWTNLLGDLHEIESLSDHVIGVISIGVAGLCGAIVGLEREKREKPAGLRTLILICVGATIFTMASTLVAPPVHPGAQGVARFIADRGRIAAQVVTGIGFLGAGAIIHERRAVVGLTTAATIWAVAAIGIVVGLGYAAAGIVLSFFIFIILTFLRILEKMMMGPCRDVTVRILFRPERGKTRQKLLSIVDENHLPYDSYTFQGEGGSGEEELGSMHIQYCEAHRNHRSFLPEIASLPEVTALEEIK